MNDTFLLSGVERMFPRVGAKKNPRPKPGGSRLARTLALAALLAGLLLAPALLSALTGLLLLLAWLALAAAALLLAGLVLAALLLAGVLLVRIVHDRSCLYFSPRLGDDRTSPRFLQITLSRIAAQQILRTRERSVSALIH
jgi:hypothetical protein